MKWIARRVVVLIAIGHAAIAAAESPWDAGIDAKTRARAQALFEQGNQLFGREAYAPALEKYEAAIALWDHPLIRLNMAITELRLDRVLEAADHLDAALRYGTAPFDAGEYKKALAQQELIAGRVGRIEASCTAAGAQVLLDGQAWLACPGRATRRVLTGTHVLLGQLDGYLPSSRRFEVAPGQTVREVMTFVPIEQAITVEYPTARWIPWTVAGSGFAVAVGGFAVDFAGRRQMDRVNARFAQRCPDGCAADLSDVPDLRDSKDAAETKNAIGVTMMIAGGVTLAAGVVWATWFNRPRRVVPAVEVHPTDGGAEARVAWPF